MCQRWELLWPTTPRWQRWSELSAYWLFLVCPLLIEWLYSLTHNHISDVSELGASLANNSTLITLKWVVCLLDFLVCQLFTERLSSLVYNQISDISALGAALAANTTLTTLKWVVCMLAFYCAYCLRNGFAVLEATKSATFRPWERPWPSTPRWQRWSELSACWIF